MGKIALVTVLIGVGLYDVAAAAPVDSERLRAQDPFVVVEQLTEFSYEQLAQMYPALSDVELRSLRWRIVNHMKGLE